MTHRSIPAFAAHLAEDPAARALLAELPRAAARTPETLLLAAATRDGARDAAPDAVTLTAAATAVVRRYRSWQGTRPATAVVTRHAIDADGARRVTAVCSRCGAAVHHGAGAATAPAQLGHRTGHCGCDGYDLVDPDGRCAP